ncbi:MAG: 16S rRNA (adenine(1518)-N(6)/adenine(1519)-N(6))-dimethyltransferase RsmA [Planctomycetota bacterium]
MTFPRTTGALRAVLEAHDIRPAKGHGQHFLTDPQAVDAIVRDAGVASADRVVEVGTGAGLLTHALAETGAEVVSFEVDERMLDLARSLRAWPPRVTFVAGDVLAGKHALADPFRRALDRRPDPPGRLLVVSNLPYGAGTPILLGVLSLPRPPDGLTVMLQREVGEKLLAAPASRAYGAPSVLVSLRARGRIVRRFGPEVFWPRPRVRSVVLSLEPRASSGLEARDAPAFGAFVTGLFSHRRKVLSRALVLAVPDLDPARAARAVTGVGLLPTARVETAGPERLLALWKAIGRA